MNRRFLLPAPAVAPVGSLGARLQAFLLRTWRGRVLLAALALFILERHRRPAAAASSSA